MDRRQWKAEGPDLWRSNWGKTKIKFLDSFLSFGLVWLRAIVPKPGTVAASSGHSGSCLGTFLSVMTRVWEDHCIWWVEARDAAQHLSMSRTPHIKLWLGSTCQQYCSLKTLVEREYLEISDDDPEFYLPYLSNRGKKDAFLLSWCCHDSLILINESKSKFSFLKRSSHFTGSTFFFLIFFF